MSVWGDALWLDEYAKYDLLLAYIRRKRWEAKLQAAMIVSRLAEAMQPKEQTMSLASLAAMGFEIEGA